MDLRDDPRGDMPRVETVLVVIPGTVNYFYNTNGRRVAEALSELGIEATVRSLREVSDADLECDLGLIVNVNEVTHGYGDPSGAERRIRALRSAARVVATIAMDSVMTPWYKQINKLCDSLGIDTIMDFGLHDQRGYLSDAEASRYLFVPDGLTGSERRELEGVSRNDPERPIPWAFVGHVTVARAEFVDDLVRRVHPSGFVYLPPIAPYTESGSPHLNHEQFRAVLSRSRYHLWCSHHHHFYMEPERFRLPLLSGCVPIKVLMEGQSPPEGVPLRPLILDRADLADLREPGRVGRYRDLLFAEYRQRSLSASLAEAMASLGLRVPERSPMSGPRHEIGSEAASPE